MSDIWSICFYFVLVTSRLHVFQICKEISSAPSCFLSSCWGGDVKNLKLLVILYLALSLFINNYCWPGKFIPWAGPECYWSNLYLEVAKQFMHVSHQVIQKMCTMFGNCLLSYMFYVISFYVHFALK